MSELNKKQLEELIETEEPQVKAVTLSEYLAYDLPPHEILLEPWLTKGGLCMVYAKRGVGKTHFALEVTMALAYGTSFLSFKAPKPVSVLYIDGEMPANVMQDRLARIETRMPENQNMIEPSFITPDLQDGPMPNLSTYEGQQSINKYVNRADVVIIDNISTLGGSMKENEAASWMPLQNFALSLRKQGKSIIFIHHAGKNGNQRGTSKREDILDTVLALKHPSDYDPSMGACFELHYEKARHMFGDSAKAIKCHLTDEGWHYQTIEASNYERVIELANEGLKQRDIAEELGLSKSQICKLYNKAKSAGRIHG